MVLEEGYDVIVSLGEFEENAIGSNCGQYVSAVEMGGSVLEGAYSYSREDMR